MKESRNTLVFLVCAAITLVALFSLQMGFRSDPDRKNYEMFTEMSYSLAYEPLSENPHFKDGSTQQPLMPGVVARGHLPFPYGPGDEEAKRAGRELKNPFLSDDLDAVTEGAELFAAYCVACHGAGGAGDGPVVSRGLPPPASLLAKRCQEMQDGWIYHILTRGQGRMSSYAAQLDQEERWKVILHVRSLQEAKP